MALLLLSGNPVIAQENKPAPTGNRELDECNAGQRASCSNYAVTLGHKKDYAGALKYAEKACQMGFDPACTNAQKYSRNLQAAAASGSPNPAGTSVSASSSAAELQSACNKGNGYACSLHAYNKGVAEDWSEAIVYARKGCLYGNKIACTNLERFTLNKTRADEDAQRQAEYAQREAQRQAQIQSQQKQQAEQRRSTDYTIPESAYSDADVSGRRSNHRSSSGGYVGSGNGSAYTPRQQVCTERYTSGSGTNSGQRIVTCR